ESRKREFMDNYKEGTQKILSRLFKISQVMESNLNKDLCNFNREELRNLLFLYMPKTVYASRANTSWLNKYINWCIEEGYLNGVNPLEGTSKEWKEQFAVKAIKRFWTKKEIDSIIANRKNAQDAVVVALLFE